jgi:hypothetical protein
MTQIAAWSGENSGQAIAIRDSQGVATRIASLRESAGAVSYVISGFSRTVTVHLKGYYVLPYF